MRRPGEDVMNVDDHVRLPPCNIYLWLIQVQRTISMTEAGSTARAVDDAEVRYI
jgi:hypothetical protein